MIIEQIGNRGYLFTFEPEDSALKSTTSVYLINTENKLFLCDTHISPASMVWINQFIDANNLGDKELIVFNTHADWDHVWGNGNFRANKIIAHNSCKLRMQEESDFLLEKYKNTYNDGMITITLPNTTFEHNLIYEEEGIEFIHTPGHTCDSAICIDHKESIIFAGDLLEEPHPLFNHYDLEQYVRTLEFLESLDKEIVLTAHSGIAKNNLLQANLNYIKHVIKNKYELRDDPDYAFNIKNALLLTYIELAKEYLGIDFNYNKFKSNLWLTLGIPQDDLEEENDILTNIPYDQLEEALKNYIESIKC
ncbi:MBL fold metallo-hydrolase [Haloplasma contractile]|uniref:Beta-lactamase-like protein n=1 Tax=Haloplasma contractile SSD-17B TaxID=1033810 RepID=U2FKQ6_9MOLU|nr:MBL fold metallo-hydrolase [Haloplasma contractile]ERJ11804.1 Beta-lactamase-like protein [Haloplasma contractile SSD-17B]